ncbi:hypothetical protein RJ639_030143 [Escallonia herrerae]|uniref:Uncharacterized protein n=1 Tax=Escallonia herrerae TaxID=1293975 RepID=A0AA88XEU6_9ASTE|nr:hypothetical protein RJ639_030143 [Escallonia herrerae]
MAPYISRVAASSSSITFHNLPAITLPPSSSYGFMDLALEFSLLNNLDVHLTLQNVTRTANLKPSSSISFVVLLLKSPSLAILTRYCYTSGASSLSMFLSLTAVHQTTIENVKDVQDYLEFLGTPPILLSDLAGPLLNRDMTAYKSFKNQEQSKQYPKDYAFLIRQIHLNDLARDEHERLRCLSSQLSRSVALLCFVSVGLFTKEQLNEMAIGLENSGQRVCGSPYDASRTAPYISRVAATTPSITFHNLLTVTLPPNSSYGTVDQLFGLPRLNNPNVHQALQTISQTSSLKAFIIDFFCDAAFEVSTSLGIPTYYFYTSGASGLSAFLYLTTLDKTTTGSIKDLKDYIEFPGTPPIFPTDLAEPLFDRHSTAYKRFIDTADHMAKSSGIIANTFESLEPRAVKAISEGLCVPNAPTPPVYYVGPLIASNDQTGDEQECLSWLSSQPSQSVVFLCFGSMGLFKAEQLTEMAIGLENSGHRFLWVVRSPPPTDDQAKHPSALPEPNLDMFVSAAELEKRVRELMDSSSGKAVRDRVREMRDGARAAIQPNGSSRIALDELLKQTMT